LGCEIGGIMMFSPSTSVQIENCYASGCWKGIHAQNTNDLQIEGFRADNCRVGLSISLGTTSEIRSCTIDGCTACSIAIGDLSTVQLYDNRFLGGDVVFLTEYASMVTGIGNVFEGGDTATIASIDAGLVLHNCHILRGTGDYVYLNGYEGESEVLDLTNNYWGTTDADQIAAWIHDGNDDPGIHAIVNFEPFSGQPLGSEQRSWGGVKALFR
jgi:hypothetical protein